MCIKTSRCTRVELGRGSQGGERKGWEEMERRKWKGRDEKKWKGGNGKEGMGWEVGQVDEWPLCIWLP